MDKENARKQEALQKAAEAAVAAPSVPDVNSKDASGDNNGTAVRGTGHTLEKESSSVSAMPQKDVEAVSPGAPQELQKDIPQPSIEVCTPVEDSSVIR